MKKILFILTAAITLAACSDEPTTPSKSSTSASIVGSWNFSSQIQNNGQILKDGTLETTFSAVTSEENGTAQFTAEGTYGTNFGYKTTYTTDTDGASSTYDQLTPPTASGGTYVHNKDAGTIVFTLFTGEIVTGTINELTTSKLVYTIKTNNSVTTDGVTTTTTADVTNSFTK